MSNARKSSPRLTSFVGARNVQFSSETISANPISEIAIAPHRRMVACEIAIRRRAVSPIFNDAKIVAPSVANSRDMPYTRHLRTYICVPDDCYRIVNFTSKCCKSMRVSGAARKNRRNCKPVVENLENRRKVSRKLRAIPH